MPCARRQPFSAQALTREPVLRRGCRADYSQPAPRVNYLRHGNSTGGLTRWSRENEGRPGKTKAAQRWDGTSRVIIGPQRENFSPSAPSTEMCRQDHTHTCAPADATQAAAAGTALSPDQPPPSRRQARTPPTSPRKPRRRPSRRPPDRQRQTAQAPCD